MEEVVKYLMDCGTFYLATVEGDQPRVRPFGAACQFEGKVYITTNNKKDVYQQMLANPKIEISGMVENSWIRLAGPVKEDTRREARVAMLDANPSLGNMYNADDELMTVFYFETGVATIATFGAQPKVIPLS